MLSIIGALYFLAASAAGRTAPSHPCSCSSGFIPVPVDVTIPVDPSVPESLNSTDTFRLRTTFEVFGVLCEPLAADSRTSHAIQHLLHGQTYNTQYWDVAWGGFQNYSYVAHSCNRGISSFSHDNLAGGRTVRPKNSKLCQLPVMAQISSTLARDLKSGRVGRILTGKEKRYERVVGIGHSLGSETINYAVIQDGSRSPFDGLILTGFNHPSNPPPLASHSAARDINPARWGDLDPGYISTVDITGRAHFYGPEGSFSPTMLQLDELTKDAGSTWVINQGPFVNVPAKGFTPPVVELVGSMDKIFCPVAEGMQCDQEALQISEKPFFPDSRNFTYIVVGGGHDVNLGFSAAQGFPVMNQLFESFVAH